jgi:membrane protease YdiL (CAAX protease family)
LKNKKKSPEERSGLLDIADDDLFDGKTTLALVGGQSLLIGVAAGAAVLIGTPNFGLGPGIDFGVASLQKGFLMTLPLGALAYVLDLVEDRFPALQDVTKATQRSVLALLGGKFKPVLGLLVATALGIAAGVGEEMLFRGVVQYELGTRFGDVLAVGLASIVFGALHAVTPLYAILASLASVYFGWLYLESGNLAVPIAAHAIYDIGALLYAHWTVANLTNEEQDVLVEWTGPLDRR